PRALHFANCDVRQFFAGARTLPQRLGWYAQSEGRSYLVLRDDSTNACHYLFDRFRRKKVVSSDICPSALYHILNLSGGAAGPSRNIGQTQARLDCARSTKLSRAPALTES